jgi:hypothetical protein
MRLVQTILALINKPLTPQIALESIIAAITHKAPEVIDLLWTPCQVDTLLRNDKQPKISEALARTDDPAVIEKFAKDVHRLFNPGQLANWVCSLATRGKIPALTAIGSSFDLMDPSPLNACRDLATARYLLERGVNPNRLGSDGCSPYLHVRRMKGAEWRALFEEFGAVLSESEKELLKRAPDPKQGRR